MPARASPPKTTLLVAGIICRLKSPYKRGIRMATKTAYHEPKKGTRTKTAGGGEVRSVHSASINEGRILVHLLTRPTVNSGTT